MSQTRNQIRAPKDMRPARPEPIVVKRLTCEGCSALPKVRPRCTNEDSEHFRQPRESYHERCTRYSFAGRLKEADADVAAWKALGRGRT